MGDPKLASTEAIETTAGSTCSHVINDGQIQKMGHTGLTMPMFSSKVANTLGDICNVNSNSAGRSAGRNISTKAVRTKGLPKNHRPARGRGRTKQLLNMTAEQKRAENILLREKNRQAAREF